MYTATLVLSSPLGIRIEEEGIGERPVTSTKDVNLSWRWDRVRGRKTATYPGMAADGCADLGSHHAVMVALLETWVT